MEKAGNRTRRAKYLDWCSARLAERFLDLSPEEIYGLARPDMPAPAGDADADESRETLPPPTDLRYRALVQRVTDALLERMPLPTYEQWSAAYEESPERFDAELLGFWKEVAAGEGPAAEGPAGEGAES